MLGQQINKVEFHNLFGKYFSNDGSWHKHIDLIKEKAWTRINIVCRSKYEIDRKSLEIIYTTFIRPILEYADVIWDYCSDYEKKQKTKKNKKKQTNKTQKQNIKNKKKKTKQKKKQQKKKKKKQQKNRNSNKYRLKQLE